MKTVRNGAIVGEIQLRPDGKLTEVGFWVGTADGKKEPTGQQIIEAIADLVSLYWDNCPIEQRNFEDYQS